MEAISEHHSGNNEEGALIADSIIDLEFGEACDDAIIGQAARIIAERELDGRDAITKFFTVVSSIVQGETQEEKDYE